MTDSEIDRDAKAFFDELARIGMIEGKSGGQLYINRTIYGTLMFFTDPKRLRELMDDIIMDFLWQTQYGFSLTPEAVKAAANVEPEADAEITVKISREMADECERWAEHALGVFLTQIRETLERTIEFHMKATMVRALLDRSGKGFYKFKVKKKEVIDKLVEDHTKAFKEEMGPHSRRESNPRKWPPERRDAFLTAYEDALEKMSRAKRIYRKNRGDKSWPAMVRSIYPDLPEDFINRLSGKGRDAEPNTLAREYAASQFGVEPNEYLEKVLVSARRARLGRQTLNPDV